MFHEGLFQQLRMEHSRTETKSEAQNSSSLKFTRDDKQRTESTNRPSRRALALYPREVRFHVLHVVVGTVRIGIIQELVELPKVIVDLRPNVALPKAGRIAHELLRCVEEDGLAALPLVVSSRLGKLLEQ